MIQYAVIKPVEEYTTPGTPVGLYESYYTKPKVLALIMIGTPLPFDFEGDKPEGERRVAFKDPIWVEETLLGRIKGTTIGKLLTTLSPMEFYEFIEHEDLTHLPIVREYYKGLDTPFKYMVGARAVAWATHYRGVVERGKVIKVNFGGKKPTIIVSEELKTIYEVAKGVYL